MYRYLKYSFFIVIIFIVGCTNTVGYNDDEIAAIVNDEEITIGELRFLYPDEKVLSMVEGAVKVTLVMQTAKQMNLNVTKEVNQEIERREQLPPEDTDNPTLRSIREFAEKQSKKLGMTPEEYQKKYIEITAEQLAYMNAYIHEMLGEPKEDELEEYNKKANYLLNELVKENKDEVKILIK